MEIGSTITQGKASQLLARWWGDLKVLFWKSKAKVIDLAESIKNLAKEDTRRGFYSLKMGLALTIVSLLYYFRPLYDFFGENGMSSLLTVVALFEFTVGETVSRILNAGLSILLAGSIGVGAQLLATLSGDKGELILLAIFVFLIAAVSTFSRFFPRVKARYDYGISTFIMTFTLVSVSSYRVHNILQFACERLLTTIIGGVTCIIISIFVRPVWAGEDLHKLVAHSIQQLASCLEAVGGEYFQLSDHGENAVVSNDNKLFLQGYRSVINSKTTEENLANFARWEPGHGRFRFHHPWKQYMEIGELTRQCVYQMEALNSCNNSWIQAPEEFRTKLIQESCRKMRSESGMALKKLFSAMGEMKNPSSAFPHIQNSKQAMEELRAASFKNADLLAITTATEVVSTLMKIVSCVEKIDKSVHELSRLAHFEGVDELITVKPVSKLDGNDQENIKPGLDGHRGDVVITVHGRSSMDSETGTNVLLVE